MNDIDLAAVDLNLLVVFEAVFQARHVGRAAQRVHVSSSAVSHGLGRLRELFDDPLFLRTPKGVVPSARATELSVPIAEILGRVREVVGSVAPFDAARSSRRFAIGASDANSALFLPPLIGILRREAPHVGLSLKNLLPTAGLEELGAGMDLLVIAVDDVPARYAAKVVHQEEFVIAARARHPFFRAPTLKHYCAAQHVLVSMTGAHHGHVDDALAEKGLSRRVALSVPNFMLALAALGDTDLLAAIPLSLAAAYARTFGLTYVKAPFAERRWPVCAVAPKVALADAGVAWLLASVERAASSGLTQRARPRK